MKKIKLNDLKKEFRIPEVAEYQELRKGTDWSDIDDVLVETGLKNSLFCICLKYNHQIVGCGRVIGDGAMYFYIQDVIVKDEYRGQGLGALIMDEIENYLNKNCQKGAFIGLMAADGTTLFYKKWGFKMRNSMRGGMEKYF